MHDYTSKLKFLDLSYPVHIHPESPPGFSKQAAVHEARKCVFEIKEKTSLQFLESPAEVTQDASFFSEYTLVSYERTNATLLFSAFGKLVSIVNEQSITAENLLAIKEVLERAGFAYLPEKVRISPRPKGLDTYATWGDRFFSYL